ncbi:hypothetical protein HC251_21585 [Iamia sp. SCSIO 61187]|uniref:hypothetical protein n=1 Tax=Iamia sp. SCSIO 61187 TaxID=2722752 RepID=UPI001C62A30F|nr:hypothetical protein [Iamia sp. SCSIO 61187]QYG94768.1 hypothetical protein HC251_21585 [Iamia sp. SCSIO 61187]
MTDQPPLPPAGDDDEDDQEPDGLVDRMRGTGVGVEDPTIVGDVGPTDVAPGADPDGGGSDAIVVEEGGEPGQV